MPFLVRHWLRYPGLTPSSLATCWLVLPWSCCFFQYSIGLFSISSRCGLGLPVFSVGQPCFCLAICIRSFSSIVSVIMFFTIFLIVCWISFHLFLPRLLLLSWEHLFYYRRYHVRSNCITTTFVSLGVRYRFVVFAVLCPIVWEPLQPFTLNWC